MQLHHLLTQVVLFSAMAASLWWVVSANRRDPDRFPLVAPLDPRFLVLIVPWFLLVVGSLWVISAQGLVPKGSTLLFATALGALVIAAVAALMAALVHMQHRLAAGWIIRVDDQTLRLQLDDLDDTILLKPGSVVARLTTKNQWLRFDISHGHRTLQLLVMAPLSELTLAAPGDVVEFIGAPLGGSSRRFCRWMRPWVKRAG